MDKSVIILDLCFTIEWSKMERTMTDSVEIKRVSTGILDDDLKMAENIQLMASQTQICLHSQVLSLLHCLVTSLLNLDKTNEILVKFRFEWWIDRPTSDLKPCVRPRFDSTSKIDCDIVFLGIRCCEVKQQLQVCNWKVSELLWRYIY